MNAEVPISPVYSITLTATGTVTVDGEEIPIRGTDLEKARIAALSEIRIKAAIHGRPVRVTAKEVDGTAWPLIVDTDGSVTTLDHPHPVDQRPEETPASPPPLSTPKSSRNPSEAPELKDTESYWNAPLPKQYRRLWMQLTEHQRLGAREEAIITADQLEKDLAADYGPHHPYTVNIMSVKAWLALECDAQAEAVELLVEVARRRKASHAPQAETRKIARNAHATWRNLTEEDPRYALEIAYQVVDVLVGDEERSRDVVRWIENGGKEQC